MLITYLNLHHNTISPYFQRINSINQVISMRGKKISIALTTGFTIAFTIRSVDRSLDPHLRGLMCWIMAGIGFFMIVQLET